MAASYLNTLQQGWLPVGHCVEGDAIKELVITSSLHVVLRSKFLLGSTCCCFDDSYVAVMMNVM